MRRLIELQLLSRKRSISELTELLAQRQLSPVDIDLELTETLLMHNPTTAFALL